MQSVQNQIYSHFKVIVTNLNEFKKSINKFKKLDEDARKTLIFHLGGPINLKDTKNYLEELLN